MRTKRERDIAGDDYICTNPEERRQLAAAALSAFNVASLDSMGGFSFTPQEIAYRCVDVAEAVMRELDAVEAEDMEKIEALREQMAHDMEDEEA